MRVGAIMNDYDRVLAGELFHPYEMKDRHWEKSRAILEAFNATPNKRACPCHDSVKKYIWKLA